QNKKETYIWLKKALTSHYNLTKWDIFNDTCFTFLKGSDEWDLLWQEKWFTDKELILSEAKLLVNSKKYTNALLLLDPLTRDDSLKTQALQYRAHIYTQLKDYGNANQDFKQLYKETGNLIFLEKQAIGYSKLKKERKVIATYKSILEKDPKQIWIFPRLAELMIQKNALEEAENLLNNYVSYIHYHKAYFLLGNIYVRRKLFEEAEKFYTLALKETGAHADYYIERAKVYFELHKFENSNNDINMALDLNPNNAEACFIKGMTSVSLNKIDEACFYFKKAFTKGYPEATSYLQKFCSNNQ
ncbi:MAG: hypothetical protein C0594_04840, partial [Marinilabiliales bacterium]